MTKIAFIGAGSFGFTRSLVRDILTFPLLEDATLALMDIDPERLDFARRAVQRIVDQGEYPAKVEATLDRGEALKGADAVLCTILAGGVDVWQHDIVIPKKYGVDINVGDTRGLAGIFRALRTIPVMLDIVKDMEQLCPNAILLNYTNPMAMLCRAMQRESIIQVTGLCHSVQGTAEMLAGWIGAPMDEITYTCAGINHHGLVRRVRVERQGRLPADPQGRHERPEDLQRGAWCATRCSSHLDYYVTESSGHNSEYNWWFRKRPDLIEKYCTHGTGWNPGAYAYILNEYLRREDDWKTDVQKWFDDADAVNLERGHEYAAYIINAFRAASRSSSTATCPTPGLITNLPAGRLRRGAGAAPTGTGFNPIHVGALPPQCAALDQRSASQSRRWRSRPRSPATRRWSTRPSAYDPLTAAVLSLRGDQGDGATRCWRRTRRTCRSSRG